MNGTAVILIAGALWLAPSVSMAQSSDRRFDVSAHVAVAGSSEFDATDVGIGGGLAWRPQRALGLDAEVTHYPSDYPDSVAFSRARWEGLFGASFGPALRRVRPFVRVRAGFVGYREAPQPFACITIFPPPLACTLGSGRTVPALEVGGGIEAGITGATFIRFDAGDRMLHYKGPVLVGRGSRANGLWSHGFRVALAAGRRF